MHVLTIAKIVSRGPVQPAVKIAAIPGVGLLDQRATTERLMSRPTLK